MKKDYLECGKIINTHGVAGEVKLESWCDSPQILAALPVVYFKKNNSYVPVKILTASIFKKFVFAKLEGIDDIDSAISLKECVVFASRDDLHLEPGSCFIADLIGLNIIDIDTGKIYGTLKGIINNGATDIYEIDTAHGEKLMPVVDEFVKRADPDVGIFVKPIEGMFENDEI